MVRITEGRIAVRRLLISLAMLLVLLLRAVPIASADEEWCSDDPPRLLTTPHGNTVAVFETLGAPGLQYAADLTAALVATSYTARSYVRDGQGDLGTVFTLSVPIANDPVLGSFPARAIVSSLLLGSGTVYATTTGVSGTTLTLTFAYPEA